MKTLIFMFLNLFVVTVGGILFAIRLIEKRQARQIAKRLETAGEKQEVSVVNLLREAESERAAGRHRWSDVTESLSNLLQQADLSWSAPRLLRTMAILAAFGLLAGALFPVILSRPISMTVLSVVGAALPVFYVRRARNKRIAKLEKQFPDALDFLARSMRAGHAFSISIGMVGDDLPDPLGREFRSLYNEHNLGASLEAAFAGFMKRVPLLDAKMFCSAALLQRRTGGNLSELLGRLAEVVRDRFRLRGQVQAASGHGRMTAGILSSMPILTMIGLIVVAPSYLQGMWQDEDGRKLVGAAIVSQILGNYVIRKIVRIKV